MPPKMNRKPRRARPAGRRPVRRAPAGARRGGRRPRAARRGPFNALISIRQQNLGQQTANKVLLNAGLPDSRAKILKQISPLCHYINTGSGTLTTSGENGRQAWGYAQIAETQTLQNIGTFLSLNTVSAALGRDPLATYLLHKCEHNLKVSNVGQGTVRLTIMHIRAKRDIYNAMVYTSPDGNVYPWGTPVDSIQQGVSASLSGPLTGDVRYLIPGVDETESAIFNKYFKKVKTTQVFMAVGGAHTLTTHVVYDKVLDASVYGNDNASSVMGITDFLLFKAEGQTGVTGTGEEVRTITIAPCQLAYTQNWDYSMVQVQNARRFNTIEDPIESNDTVVNVISGSTGAGTTTVGLIQ